MIMLITYLTNTEPLIAYGQHHEKDESITTSFRTIGYLLAVRSGVSPYYNQKVCLDNCLKVIPF